MTDQLIVAGEKTLPNPRQTLSVRLAVVYLKMSSFLWFIAPPLILLHSLINLFEGHIFEFILRASLAVFFFVYGMGRRIFASFSCEMLRLRCEDVTPSKLKPLFSKIEKWRKLPDIKSSDYFLSFATLSALRALAGDIETGINELRTVLEENKKASTGLIGKLTYSPLLKTSDVRAILLGNLGGLLLMNDQKAEAESMLLESISLYEQKGGDSLGEVFPRSDMVRLLIEQGKFEDAQKHLDIALQKLKAKTSVFLVYLNTDIELLVCTAYSALLHYKKGEDAVASEILEELISLLPTAQNSWVFLSAGYPISLLAQHLMEKGDLARAEQLIYLSSNCLYCETHPDYLMFKAASDSCMQRLEKHD